MNKLTLLCHFYNEEYLLPWWLNHHKLIFDHGIMINYNSTDSSVDLIKSICPSWDIVNSRNTEFKVTAIDDEIYDIEAGIVGPRIVLNVTEFIYGNFNLLKKIGQTDGPENLIIPVGIPVEKQYGIEYDYNKHLLLQIPWWGVDSTKPAAQYRRCRLAHDKHQRYPFGRHFHDRNTEELMIYWHGYSPLNDRAIERKLQISPRIPQSDLAANMGLEHKRNKEEWLAHWDGFKTQSEDMTNEIQNYINLSEKALGISF